MYRFFNLTNETYDLFNRVVKYVLPAIGAAYFALAQIWGLPYGEEVVGTIAVLTTLLAAILAASSHAYKVGELESAAQDRKDEKEPIETPNPHAEVNGDIWYPEGSSPRVDDEDPRT